MIKDYTPKTEEVRSVFVMGTIDVSVPYDESIEANDEMFDRWFEQVQREAKAEVLRETAERISQLRDVSCMARDGMTDRQAAMERDYQYFRESPVGWLLDRADQMEAEG